MIETRNSFRHNNCPLCSSLKINKLGIISYDLPIMFSTNEIVLDLLYFLKFCALDISDNSLRVRNLSYFVIAFLLKR